MVGIRQAIAYVTILAAAARFTSSLECKVGIQTISPETSGEYNIGDYTGEQGGLQDYSHLLAGGETPDFGPPLTAGSTDLTSLLNSFGGSQGGTGSSPDLSSLLSMGGGAGSVDWSALANSLGQNTGGDMSSLLSSLGQNTGDMSSLLSSLGQNPGDLSSLLGSLGQNPGDMSTLLSSLGHNTGGSSGPVDLSGLLGGGTGGSLFPVGATGASLLPPGGPPPPGGVPPPGVPIPVISTKTCNANEQCTRIDYSLEIPLMPGMSHNLTFMDCISTVNCSLVKANCSDYFYSTAGLPVHSSTDFHCAAACCTEDNCNERPIHEIVGAVTAPAPEEEEPTRAVDDDVSTPEPDAATTNQTKPDVGVENPGGGSERLKPVLLAALVSLLAVVSLH